jgi:hypothetical protein
MTKSKISMQLMHGNNKIALSLCAGDAILDRNKKNKKKGMTTLIAA